MIHRVPINDPAAGKEKPAGRLRARRRQEGNQTMFEIPHRTTIRKRPVVSTRIHFVSLAGFRRRLRWTKPFAIQIYRIERRELGAR